MRTREEEYLKKMKVLGYEPDLRGLDDDDIEWELNKMDGKQGSQLAETMLNRVYRPPDRDFAARIFKMFARPFDPNWRMPDLDGLEYRQPHREIRPQIWLRQVRGVNAEDGRQVAQTMEFRGGRDGKVKTELFAGATKGGQGDGGNSVGLNWSVDPLGMFPQYDGMSASGGTSGKSSSESSAGSQSEMRSTEIAVNNPYAGGYTDGGAYGDMLLPEAKAQADNMFGDKVLSIGRKQLGLTYDLGGDGIKTTDCGKFTLDTFKKVGIDLGTRMADEQYDFCKTNGSVFNDMSQARPGDLVFFHNTYGNWAPGTITHVGIYAGNGKMLHAGRSKGVSYADLNSEYWQSHLSGFGRPRR